MGGTLKCPIWHILVTFEPSVWTDGFWATILFLPIAWTIVHERKVVKWDTWVSHGWDTQVSHLTHLDVQFLREGYRGASLTTTLCICADLHKSLAKGDNLKVSSSGRSWTEIVPFLTPAAVSFLYSVMHLRVLVVVIASSPFTRFKLSLSARSCCKSFSVDSSASALTLSSLLNLLTSSSNWVTSWFNVLIFASTLE